ncbi:MAG: hypothetical protein OXI87_14375 [Albidovulum sp.]|nr:hypothetical protein [Albidovulum sp.]MDE0532590.1 hypothetical protein [Albidovulum sp.]
MTGERKHNVAPSPEERERLQSLAYGESSREFRKRAHVLLVADAGNAPGPGIPTGRSRTSSGRMSPRSNARSRRTASVPLSAARERRARLQRAARVVRFWRTSWWS